MTVIVPEKQTVATASFDFSPSYVYLISAIAALGGLLFGFDLVIISGTVPFFTKHFNLDQLQTG